MLCNNGVPVQACAIARSPKVEGARASCSVGLKKLFCVYGVLPCGFCGSRSQQFRSLIIGMILSDNVCEP